MNNKAKAGVAFVCFLAAAILILNSMGVFGGGRVAGAGGAARATGPGGNADESGTDQGQKAGLLEKEKI